MPPERYKRRKPFFLKEKKPWEKSAFGTKPFFQQRPIARLPAFQGPAVRYPRQPAQRPFPKGAGKPERQVRRARAFGARAAASSAARAQVSSFAPYVKPEWARSGWSGILVIGPIIDFLTRLIFPREKFRETKRLPLGSSARGLAQTGLERAKAGMLARVERKQRMQRTRARQQRNPATMRRQEPVQQKKAA